MSEHASIGKIKIFESVLNQQFYKFLDSSYHVDVNT